MELQASAWWMRSRLTPQHQAEAWSSIYDRIIFLMFISALELVSACFCFEPGHLWENRTLFRT